ncbi:hypothetical protein LWI28_018518 [Acer negundo]|uniref:Uncharacterized protein n=1 Tax=Acer negundo TaxID=4023 RepID=A0AAD5J9X8_ACENE|nr:hypothetical protein LWI28_018518 [Acer negundo]
MSDHVVLFVDRLMSSPESVQEEDNLSSIVEKEAGPSSSVENADDLGEDKSLIQRSYPLDTSMLHLLESDFLQWACCIKGRNVQILMQVP